MTPTVRSVLSILGAFFVVAVLVALARTVAAGLMLESPGAGSNPTAPFLIVELIYNVVGAIAGGYVAATVSDHSPLGHAAALSVFMILLGLASWLMELGQPVSGPPGWYRWIIILLVPPTAVLGGILVTRRTRARTHYSKRAREADGPSRGPESG